MEPDHVLNIAFINFTADVFCKDKYGHLHRHKKKLFRKIKGTKNK